MGYGHRPSALIELRHLVFRCSSQTTSQGHSVSYGKGCLDGYYNYVGCVVYYKMSCVCAVLVALLL